MRRLAARVGVATRADRMRPHARAAGGGRQRTRAPSSSPAAAGPSTAEACATWCRGRGARGAARRGTARGVTPSSHHAVRTGIFRTSTRADSDFRDELSPDKGKIPNSSTRLLRRECLPCKNGCRIESQHIVLCGLKCGSTRTKGSSTCDSTDDRSCTDIMRYSAKRYNIRCDALSTPSDTINECDALLHCENVCEEKNMNAKQLMSRSEKGEIYDVWCVAAPRT